MNCEKAIEITSDYIDGLLPYHTRCEYEAHINNCAKCAYELDEMRKMLSSLSSLAVRGSSVDLWPAIRAVIIERGQKMSIWRFLLRPVIVAPAAAFAAALAVMIALPNLTKQPDARRSVSMPEYGHYINVHAQSQLHNAFVDPDLTLVAAELERARLTDAD